MNVRSRWLLISVGLGVLLNPLNSSMIAVAIPGLQNVFQLDFTVVSWIIFSFYIASAIAQPVMGKASDLFGRRKIFLTGLVVAFVASLLAPLSPNFGWLIVFRIVQSIGTSMMVAVGMAIVRIYITEKQATALSVMSIFLSGAAAIGPFIWIDKSGLRPALLVSGILMTLGSVWLVTLNQTSPVISVCLALAAFGISNGLNNVVMQAALFKSSPKEIIGVASGVFMTSRYLGTILSSLLLGIVMGDKFSAGGFRLLGAILSVIALSLVFMSWRRRESGQLEES